MRVVILVLLCFIENLWAQSVLSKGLWFKLAVLEEGVYRVDFALLKTLGVEPAAIDPAKVHIYGHPAGPLAQSLQRPYLSDIVEQATYLFANADNAWGENEYLLFYAVGADNYRFNTETKRFTYTSHPYSEEAYYFLSIQDQSARRMSSYVSPADPSATAITTYQAYYAHEKERHNFLRSGRIWYGESLSSPSQRLHFSLPFAPIAGASASVSWAAAGACQSTCSLTLRYGQQVVGAPLSFQPVMTGPYKRRADHHMQTTTFTIHSSEDVVYTFQSNRSSDVAYLDYFFLQASAALRYETEALFFSALGTASGDPFVYEAEAPMQSFLLWEVATFAAPQLLSYTYQNNRIRFTYAGRKDQLPRFALFSVKDTQRPRFVSKIETQDLLAQTVPQFLIITHPLLQVSAQRLAHFHSTYDLLNTLVTTTEEIYHQFSAARPSPIALRNYIHFLTQKSPHRLQYVLLFGAATFDYKGILNRLSTHVPTYLSVESLDPILTYGSDDYFGLLEEEEGLWEESATTFATLDLGVGRLPARSAEQAEIIVNKIISYATKGAVGPWQQRITFVADDGDGHLHHRDAEKLIETLVRAAPSFRAERMYLDFFPQRKERKGQRAPQATARLLQLIEDGSLVINFNGHGNTSFWTKEEIFTRSHIHELKNQTQLPLFVTATCDFGRHDDPNTVSAGEELLFHPYGGAIALLTHARPIRSDVNFRIDSAFLRALPRHLPSGKWPRLGDVIRNTKNGGNFGISNRSFTLLGDPALQLSYPALQVALTEINGTQVENFQDTLPSHSLAHLKGQIQNLLHVPVSDYKGELQITIYDQALSMRTLGDEGTPFTYPAHSSLLFQGLASIENGQFSFQVPIPRDISYKKAPTRMYFYASSETHIKEVAIGGLSSVYVGGTAADVVSDAKGPSIHAYLNHPSFTDGAQTGLKNTLFISLRDEQGIKLSETDLSKQLSFVLDQGQHVQLSTFFWAEKDSYTSGNIVYPLERLSEGPHHIRIYAWDNLNNFSSKSLNFFVSTHTKIKIFNVTNYPNPANLETIFSFTHDKGNHLLNVKLRVYEIEGKNIYNKSWHSFGNNGKIDNLRSDFPAQAKSGTYAYQLLIEDEEEGTRGMVVGKLIVRK